jgi:chemotaxis protein methyltransferase CheR
MRTEHISREEYNDILDIIRSIYGYDFSGYAQASLKRRLLKFMHQYQLSKAFDLKHMLVNQNNMEQPLLNTLTVNVTEMFRDPAFFSELRNTLLPMLASYPTIQIWHPGCATGEEVYSMAILLHEAGLLKRSRIYATDINPANLEKAKQGIIPISHMKAHTYNYILSGGTKEFSDYYTARYGNAIIHKELRRHIVFSQHNLVTDAAFNRFQLICCRNVLIYFNKALQNRVLQLFYDSLQHLGYLALGTKESLMSSDIHNEFETVNTVNKIFRRIS